MNDLISVVVPVYKAPKALPRCIESIQKQTYKNLEIILVDDGSPDKCSTICDKYAAKDARIKVIHQKNSGLCVARNIGIAYSLGGYICFCDDDDIMPPYAIEHLYKRIIETASDFVCGNYCMPNKSLSPKPSSSWRKREYLISDPDSLSSFFHDCANPYFTPWGKLYRRDIMVENKVEFLPEMVMGEDTNFVYNYLLHCKKIATITDNVYYWCRFGETSESRHYHATHNRCHYINQKIRLQFFDPAKLPNSEQIAILEYFWITLRVYVRSLPENQALEKLKETCEMFREFLVLVHAQRLQESDNKYVKFYNEIKEYIDENDYKAVYEFIAKREKISSGFKAEIRKVERKILHSLLSFMVYRLKWFYHKK